MNIASVNTKLLKFFLFRPIKSTNRESICFWRIIWQLTNWSVLSTAHIYEFW